MLEAFEEGAGQGGDHIGAFVDHRDIRERKRGVEGGTGETQDYVRESLNLSREEAEEIRFVPSAIGIPQRPMFWCDNRCSGKALSFWQFVSVVVLQRKFGGKRSCIFEELAVVVEKKVHWGRLWRMLGEDQ